VFDETSWLLGQALRATALRHQVIARNLANLETPGFQAQDVKFQEVLRSALAAKAAPDGQGDEAPWVLPIPIRFTPETDGPRRQDKNTVDLDREMVKLVQNTLFHNTLVQLLNAKFQLLRTALQDRL